MEARRDGQAASMSPTSAPMAHPMTSSDEQTQTNHTASATNTSQAPYSTPTPTHISSPPTFIPNVDPNVTSEWTSSNLPYSDPSHLSVMSPYGGHSELSYSDMSNLESSAMNDDDLRDFDTYLSLGSGAQQSQGPAVEQPQTVNPQDLSRQNTSEPTNLPSPLSSTAGVQGSQLSSSGSHLLSPTDTPSPVSNYPSHSPSRVMRLLHQMSRPHASLSHYSPPDANSTASRSFRGASAMGTPSASSPEANVSQTSSRSDRAQTVANHPSGGSNGAMRPDMSQSRESIGDESDSHSQSRKGLRPEERSKLGGAEVPSLEEQEKQRGRSHTNEEVKQWLTSTTSDPPNIGAAMRAANPKEAYQYHKALQNMDSGVQGKQSPADQSYFFDSDEDSDLDERPPTPPGSKAFVAQSKSEARKIPFRNVFDTSEQYQTLRHWSDSRHDAETSSIMEAPPDSSTAAIERFQRKAKEVETASLAATYASSTRRGTETGSLFSGFSSRVPSIAMPGAAEPMAPRRESLLNKVQRSFHRHSDARKRKESHGAESKRKESQGSDQKRKESQGTERNSSLDLTKTESDGSLRKVQSSSQKKPSSTHDFTARPGLSPNTAASFNLAPRSSPFSMLRRNRSRSDVSQGSALAQKWATHGGPPVAVVRTTQEQLSVPGSHADEEVPPEVRPYEQNTLQSKLHELEQLKTSQFPQYSEGVVDDEDEDDGSRTPTNAVDPSRQMAVPQGSHLDDFRAHVMKVAPNVQPYLAERLALEQVKRYQRLMKLREDHEILVKSSTCKSGHLCSASTGNGPRILKPAKSKGTKDSASAIYKVNPNTPAAEIQFLDLEETPQQASFPYGIPHPPVKQLPAEFECPICFRVKKIQKPSDWSKHCYEDLHPFTCSFEDCAQPKSFNRKADWARHENETHRQLESWLCSFPDCGHTCHRRDNFVQHLVRVHNLQEPRAQGPRRKAVEDSSEASRLVISCRHDSAKDPSDEPCMFCGAVYKTWKETCVHLSKHMMQISLPLLVQIEQHNGRVARFYSSNGASHQSAAAAQEANASRAYQQAGQIGNDANATHNMPMYNNEGHTEYQEPSMVRQPVQTFPGTKNLQREQPPLQGMMPQESYNHTPMEQSYIPEVQAAQNHLHVMPDLQGRRSPSTYPPAFMTNNYSGFSGDFNAGSSQYVDQTMYTTSPTVGDNMLGGEAVFNHVHNSNIHDGTNFASNGQQQFGGFSQPGMYHLADGAHPSIYFPADGVGQFSPFPHQITPDGQIYYDQTPPFQDQSQVQGQYGQQYVQ